MHAINHTAAHEANCRSAAYTRQAAPAHCNGHAHVAEPARLFSHSSVASGAQDRPKGPEATGRVKPRKESHEAKHAPSCSNALFSHSRHSPPEHEKQSRLHSQKDPSGSRDPKHSGGCAGPVLLLAALVVGPSDPPNVVGGTVVVVTGSVTGLATVADVDGSATHSCAKSGQQSCACAHESSQKHVYGCCVCECAGSNVKQRPMHESSSTAVGEPLEDAACVVGSAVLGGVNAWHWLW